MISPKRPDGPPVRYGKPYSQIAHLAEDVIPFFAIQRGLLLEGFSAPELFAKDAGNGLAILEDLFERTGRRLILTMEMFERDQQVVLDQHLAGVLSEEELGKKTKLWGNYTSDYAPMVRFAAKNMVPVVAANCPNSIIRKVGQGGIDALTKLPESERRFAAKTVIAPAADAYADKFTETMSGMGGSHGPAMDPAMLRRIYEAQCTRDDTMAESIHRAMTTGSVVLHINGGFHSESGLGTVARLQWRRPLGHRSTVIQVVPVKGSLKSTGVPKGQATGTYVVFVPDRRKSTDG
jgi:uncharacterized iron-regulated protein